MFLIVAALIVTVKHICNTVIWNDLNYTYYVNSLLLESCAESTVEALRQHFFSNVETLSWVVTST